MNAWIAEQEQKVHDNIDKLVEASNKVLEARKGLSEAAYHLSGMYETMGMYKVALLWSFVSYKQGYVHSKEDAHRLFLLIDTPS